MEFYLNQSDQIEARRLRALFNWGQGVFTSFQMKEGEVLFQEDHEKRLKESFELLFGKICSFDFKKEFAFLRGKTFSGKGRLCLFLDENKECASLLELSPFNKKDKLKVKTIKEDLACDQNMKLPFYALHFKFLEGVRELGFDDYLNLDEKNHLIELSTSNLLVFKDEKTLLAPIHERAFAGIMQRRLATFFKEEGLKVEFRKVSLSEAKEAMALFATNSVQCMSFLQELDNVEFQKTASVIEWEGMANIFCEKNYGKK